MEFVAADLLLLAQMILDALLLEAFAREISLITAAKEAMDV